MLHLRGAGEWHLLTCDRVDCNARCRTKPLREVESLCRDRCLRAMRNAPPGGDFYPLPASQGV